MQKTYFHNNKLNNENKNKLAQTSNINMKRVVDVNILLNRVKVEKKNQTKRKIIFFTLVTFALSSFAAIIVIIK